MWTADKESLCSMHDTIKYWTNDVKKKLKKAIKDGNVESIKESVGVLNTILETTRRAKKTGQKLENRLSNYRHHIESLGFMRKGSK